jgi:hypothetical protein
MRIVRRAGAALEPDSRPSRGGAKTPWRWDKRGAIERTVPACIPSQTILSPRRSFYKRRPYAACCASADRLTDIGRIPPDGPWNINEAFFYYISVCKWRNWGEALAMHVPGGVGVFPGPAAGSTGGRILLGFGRPCLPPLFEPAIELIVCAQSIHPDATGSHALTTQIPN